MKPAATSYRCGAIRGHGYRRVACLADLDPEEVAAAAFAAPPGSVVELRNDDCSECPFARGNDVHQLFISASALLERVRQPEGNGAVGPLTRIRLARPQQARDPDPVGSGVTRRELVARWATRRKSETDKNNERVRHRAALISAASRTVAPALPRPAVEDACHVCGACATVCPTQALKFGRVPGGAADRQGYVLAVDPAACIACGQCVDACPVAAVGLVSPLVPDPAEPRRIVLAHRAEAYCTSCGLRLGPDERERCHRCRTSEDLLSELC